MNNKSREEELRNEFGVDGSKTLTQIENDDWGPAPPNESGVISRGHMFRYIPIAELSDEQLRYMLVQEIGLDSIVPAAIVWLRRDPTAGGNMIEGTLLRSLLEVSPSFYQYHPNLREKVEALLPFARKAAAQAALRGEILLANFEESLREGMKTFGKAQHGM